MEITVILTWILLISFSSFSYLHSLSYSISTLLDTLWVFPFAKISNNPFFPPSNPFQKMKNSLFWLVGPNCIVIPSPYLSCSSCSDIFLNSREKVSSVGPSEYPYSLLRPRLLAPPQRTLDLCQNYKKCLFLSQSFLSFSLINQYERPRIPPPPSLECPPTKKSNSACVLLEDASSIRFLPVPPVWVTVLPAGTTRSGTVSSRSCSEASAAS